MTTSVSPTDPPNPPAERFDELSAEASAAITAGDLPAALKMYDQAQKLARELGDQDRIDRTICNRSALLLELGEGGTLRTDLQTILMRSADPEVRYLAAYTLSRDYEWGGIQEKALFYAGIANRHAAELDTTDRLAISHVRLAVLHISSCDFKTAESELKTARELLPQAPSERHVFVSDHLGYCYVMQERYRKGFRELFAGLRLARRLSCTRYEMIILTTLAFAYLQFGRPRRGMEHALKAQQIAESVNDRVALKPALFTLGEAHKQIGNPLGARRCFERLQEEYYPDMPGVSDLLLVLNVQSFINLKA